MIIWIFIALHTSVHLYLPLVLLAQPSLQCLLLYTDCLVHVDRHGFSTGKKDASWSKPLMVGLPSTMALLHFILEGCLWLCGRRRFLSGQVLLVAVLPSCLWEIEWLQAQMTCYNGIFLVATQVSFHIPCPWLGQRSLRALVGTNKFAGLGHLLWWGHPVLILSGHILSLCGGGDSWIWCGRRNLFCYLLSEVIPVNLPYWCC